MSRGRPPEPQGQGGLALLQVAVADGVGAVGGDAEGGVEPVEGLLGGPLGLGLPQRVGVVVVPVAVVQVVGQVGVVVGPGVDLRVLSGQVSDGVAVLPVLRVELAGLGGQLGLV